MPIYPISRRREIPSAHWRKLAAFGLLAALTACGGLPRPFEGRIGANGERLSQPPPSRLAVAPPTNAMLTDIGADTLAGALVDSLVSQEIPAVLDTPRKGDWSLSLTADLQGGKVTPHYEVHDPSGKPMGTSAGLPVAASAWADAAPQTMRDAAKSAAGPIAALLVRIDAAQRESDPNSLMNRPARVDLAAVTGAPGDGNLALARELRAELTKLGEVVQDTPDNADFTVVGQVNMAVGAKGTQRVEIQWTVNDQKKQEIGRIVQLNEVPPGTLDKLWGDVAFVVAKEAAGGVKDVILNQPGARKPS